MAEPTVRALGGSAPGHVARRLLLATRPPFFTASVLPVLLGTAWGAREAGGLDAVAIAVGLVAVVLAHAAGNVLNDVYDDLSGADRFNEDRLYPFTGGSRFIQNGVMTRAEMGWWGAALVALAVLAGLLLIALKGPWVVAFGVAGLGLGLLYSMPPVKLNARGLGEAVVGIAFGVLPVCGAAWLQTGAVTPEALLLSLPVAAWVANILVINEVPDAEADARAGKRTLAVRLGPAGTRGLYQGLHAAAALAVLAAVAGGMLAVPALALPLAIAIAAPLAARGIAVPPRRGRLLAGIKLTLAAHAAGTLWLAGWALAG